MWDILIIIEVVLLIGVSEADQGEFKPVRRTSTSASTNLNQREYSQILFSKTPIVFSLFKYKFKTSKLSVYFILNVCMYNVSAFVTVNYTSEDF